MKKNIVWTIDNSRLHMFQCSWNVKNIWFHSAFYWLSVHKRKVRYLYWSNNILINLLCTSIIRIFFGEIGGDFLLDKGSSRPLKCHCAIVLKGPVMLNFDVCTVSSHKMSTNMCCCLCVCVVCVCVCACVCVRVSALGVPKHKYEIIKLGSHDVSPGISGPMPFLYIQMSPKLVPKVANSNKAAFVLIMLSEHVQRPL